MINLIPPAARRAVTREYWIRVVSIWLGMLSLALLLIIALQVPTYILINSYSKALNNQFTTAEAIQAEFEVLEDEVKAANTLVQHLAADDTPHIRFSELKYELDGIAANDVSLQQFSMQREAGSINTITIVGTAIDRTALSNFRDSVEASERFAAAELPISNLAKDKDIVFSMNITMAEQN